MKIDYKLAFSISEISNKKKLYILNKYNNFEEIYNNRDDKYIKEILKNSEIEELFNFDSFRINNMDKYMKENSIGYITILDEEYPKELLNINEPPVVLFYKGDISVLKSRKLGIVGARDCTMQGREITKYISEAICDSITIVSGVAKGIDSIAQSTAIENGCNTIGVLGSGIDVVYPKVNKGLFQKIALNGVLLSEFIPGTQPLKQNFPRRNRIISGLSEGLIVVEASIRSGSLITVDYALEEGKNIMAVPGSVLNSKSLGTNKLIKEGAAIYTEREDLYTYFKIPRKNIKNKAKSTLEEGLLKVINKEPTHIDNIMSLLNVDRSVLYGVLFEMQNRKEIICLPGNYYAKLS